MGASRSSRATGQLSHTSERSTRLASLPPLQYIEVIQSDKDFYGLWESVLKALQASNTRQLNQPRQRANPQCTYTSA